MIVLVTGLQGAGKSTIAEGCAGELGAPVFAWDWCVAALTPFEPLQRAMRSLDRETYRALGWAMVFQPLARRPGAAWTSSSTAWRVTRRSVRPGTSERS